MSAPNIRIIEGDITAMDVDAIVNAANSSLLGGGGVDGAIHAAAGPELLKACRSIREDALPDGLPVGEAVATPGFELRTAWVIHTVGPNRHAGQTEPALLESCFRRSLAIADDVGARSVAFPAISAGIYGWDPETVARLGLGAVRKYDGGVREVTFVLFSERLAEIFQRVHDEIRT
ncbi:O-acetyl-ADP-ribose deacetylase (regulator of RNase III) [Arthrobacter pigmenti]|uniref:O-acetyl-ADP-ribose deacetylase (Regulator of RNase III) n=1 Tax=Arthrobacter pigmenti TaxID=271432 RepID=A0A846RNY7_9MICC|nr:O-acetyl-ADP-ribose deacetylase [Arthrobacter pigmenti]NJC22322.1 O-acetyl-ADP-ribose deacetylase (regulator of RNase III) [Arthrobacter pigmenti]